MDWALHHQLLIKKRSNHLESCRQWINLEKNILSEVTQTQKDKYNMFPLISCTGTELHKKTKRNADRKKHRERHHGATRVRYAKSLPVSHCHVAIHRLIEMG